MYLFILVVASSLFRSIKDDSELCLVFLLSKKSKSPRLSVPDNKEDINSNYSFLHEVVLHISRSVDWSIFYQNSDWRKRYSTAFSQQIYKRLQKYDEVFFWTCARRLSWCTGHVKAGVMRSWTNGVPSASSRHRVLRTSLPLTCKEDYKIP